MKTNTGGDLSAELEATIDRLLQLPPEQRLAIGERLIESVQVVIDDEAMEIYKRRAQELRDGTVQGIPADEVMTEIRKMLDEEFPLPS
ncbi:MAG: hypothetical protein DWQ34_00745 [Planctomycetota bacterium]|nr:MAG: hypothetical protein DWQ29_06150 [Planctomycetota bacterium]REJ97899.1 MAG: hypothetical protein DWQ34_00745 [Planctomycetota bacterium]REK25630.1 MAG: hypothetical protein DWQ41_11905 [Planctomycetota bacterium]REK31659.1 MAG: hypothetical protein DWQ45_18780 [Planctomycetota bacterium]